MAREPAIVVHGGAAPWDSAYHDAARAGCRAAVDAGLAVLARGGSAVDAVVAAVRALEEAPVFNAGVGAVLTRAGTFELDAAIMDGHGLRFGGVAAMANARAPIEVARAVMEDGEHALLCAEGAWAFARERGFAPCDPAELRTERAAARLRAVLDQRARRAGGDGPGDAPGAAPGADDPGTVGACAIDAQGHVAAATSTGGITGKRPGRIGDTPLPGCGTYADDRGGAASATGVGEAIMRVAMTKACVTRLARGHDALGAVRASVDELATDGRGEGGIICCDRNGRLGAAHNSSHMAYGAGILHEQRRTIIDGIALPPGTDLMALLARNQG
jgi:beta-aspartyl-peptidase (threonine type)